MIIALSSRKITHSLQGRKSKTKTDGLSQDKKKEIDEFLGTLEQVKGAAWRRSPGWWEKSDHQHCGYWRLHPHQGHLPRQGDHRGEHHHRGVHQSSHLQAAGEEKPPSNLVRRVHHQKRGEASGPVRGLRHPPLHGGEDRGQGPLPPGASLPQVNRSEGMSCWLFICQEIHYDCVGRQNKPKQSARFLLRFCCSTDGISMKLMCMLMRTPPSPGPGMIKWILAITLLSLITKGYLSFRSRALTLRRFVSNWIIFKSLIVLSQADVKSTSSSVEPEMTLYEGLQIMRKGRFEDQRGTEICFEIPEFLRLPESNKTWKIALVNKPRNNICWREPCQKKRGTNHSSNELRAGLAIQLVKPCGLGLMAVLWFTVIVRLLDVGVLSLLALTAHRVLFISLSQLQQHSAQNVNQPSAKRGKYDPPVKNNICDSKVWSNINITVNIL